MGVGSFITQIPLTINVAFFHSFNFHLKMKVGINLVNMPTCHLNCNNSLSDTCLCFIWREEKILHRILRNTLDDDGFLVKAVCGTKEWFRNFLFV